MPHLKYVHAETTGADLIFLQRFIALGYCVQMGKKPFFRSIIQRAVRGKHAWRGDRLNFVYFIAVVIIIIGYYLSTVNTIYEHVVFLFCILNRSNKTMFTKRQDMNNQ